MHGVQSSSAAPIVPVDRPPEGTVSDSTPSSQTSGQVEPSLKFCEQGLSKLQQINDAVLVDPDNQEAWGKMLSADALNLRSTVVGAMNQWLGSEPAQTKLEKADPQAIKDAYQQFKQMQSDMCAPEVDGVPLFTRSADESSKTGGAPHSEMYTEISGFLGKTNEDLKKWAKAADKYNELYGKVNSLSYDSFMKPPDGDGKQVFDAAGFKAEVEKLMSQKERQIAGPFTSKTDADMMTERMPGTVAEQNDKGEWVVCVDPAPLKSIVSRLDNMINNGKKVTGGIELSASQINIWTTDFQSQKDYMQNSIQNMMSKLSRANSQFDSMVKLLMNAITQLSESDKQFVSR